MKALLITMLILLSAASIAPDPLDCTTDLDCLAKYEELTEYQMDVIEGMQK